MTKSSWMLCVLVAAGLFGMGCGPSQEELDAELARVRDLQGQLREAQERGDGLEARLSAIANQNEQLASRLRALGENVEELEGTRVSLQGELEQTRRALAELREREEQATRRLAQFRQILQQLRSLIDAGTLQVEVRNGRMVVVLPEAILFDSGRADLKPEAREPLAQVARVLRSIQGRTYQVMGHTDNIPIRSRRFASNWELSTARAVVVAKYLIEQGLEGNRLSAAGFADTQPLNQNATPEERGANRRIEVALNFNLDELPDLSSIES